MGKYPRELLSFFNEFLQQPLLLLVVILAGSLIVLRVIQAFPKTVLKFTALKIFLETTGFAIVIGSALWIASYTRDLTTIGFVSFLIALFMALRNPILSLLLGFLVRYRKLFNIGDIIGIEDQVGKIDDMANWKLTIRFNRNEKKNLTYVELLFGGIKNYAQEPLIKNSLTFSVNNNITTEDIHQMLRDILVDHYYID
jgi:hypothetical protein